MCACVSAVCTRAQDLASTRECAGCSAGGHLLGSQFHPSSAQEPQPSPGSHGLDPTLPQAPLGSGEEELLVVGEDSLSEGGSQS